MILSLYIGNILKNGQIKSFLTVEPRPLFTKSELDSESCKHISIKKEANSVTSLQTSFTSSLYTCNLFPTFPISSLL